MADRILSSGATVAQSLGIRPPMRQTITTGLADLEVEKQAALDRIAGLGAASAPRLRPPPDSALRAGPDIYYSPSTDRYAAGGMEFGATEYDVALRAMENLQAPTAPPGGDFQRIAPSTLEAYRQSISEGRGFFGNLGVGAQNVGEGLVGGIGRGLQMLGAEGAGQALVDVGEAIGVSPAEQARSAAIAQGQGLAGQIGTAAVQSAPTLGVAIGAGLAGAAVGGPVGALAGVALSILPMELQASWEAAEQGGLDTSDPEIQTEILASTLFKTGVQTFGTAYLARGLSPAFRTMLGDVSKRTMGARITRGIGAGALEGSAEAIAQATDRVAFDPELRASMTEGDWAAIAPAFVNKYGTEALVAFGAGFLLGAPLGAIASPEATTQTSPSPRRNVDSGQQIDALSGATLEPQALPTPAPVAGLLPPPPAALPAPPAGLLPAPPAALPAPDRSAAAAPDIIVPPAPAGSVAPPVVPAPAAPAAPVAPAPITAPDLGLEGPVAEGFNIASLRQGPPAPPPRVTPQVFSAGPAESTVQSPFVEPMNALRQQQVARMERLAAEGVAQKRAKEARLEAEQRGAAAWDALVEEQGGVDFIALPARAQEAWINAVAANVGPRGQTLQQYFDALVGAAGRAGRRQQAEATPEPTTPSIPGAPPTGSRATRTTPQEEAALAGVQVGSVDEAIANGIGTITVTENGQPVPFKNFALSVDGDRAEVGMVERERGKTRAGIGRDAYVALGDALAARGITLQSSELLQAPGKRLWERLVLEGKARRNPQTKRFEYIARTPTAPKSDVVSETTVGRDGLTLVHGGRPGLTIDTVNIIRPAGQMKQGKKGRRYGGFYATTEADAAQAEGYAGADGEVYDVRVRPGTRIAQRAGDITRLSETVINQYVADGYGVVYGKDPRGRTEYVVINKAAIESIAPRTPPTPPTDGETTRTPPQEGAAKARARQQAAAAKITKGTRGAVQEQGPEAGAVRQGPEDGQAVGEGDAQGQEAAGTRVEEVQEEVAADYQPLAQPRSEAFGTFTRLRVMRRGDQYVEQRRADEIDGGRVTKPGQWKYSSTLLDKARMDARYQKRKDEGFETGLEAEIAVLPEGPPPARPRRGAGAEVQIVEGRGGRRELEPVAPAEPEAIAEPEAPQTAQQRVAAEDLAEVDALIEAVETTSNEAEAAQQLAALVEWSEAGSKAAKARAQEFLTDMEADPATARQVATARSKAKLGTDISKARSDVEKARKSVADGKKGAEKKLADAEAKLEKLQRDAAKVGGASKSAADQIVSVIEKVNAGGVVSLGDRSKLVRWWSEAKADNPQYNDRPLADYITGDPDFFNYGPRVNGHRQVVPKGAGRTSRTTFNFVGGAFNNLDGSSISRALPYGKAKLVISSFRSKLKRAPSVKVFTSVAQLKRKDPALYARAAAARSQGDFDNVTAAGYSFGDGEVLIFTDNVANEAHLRFVLAHETMGHYGLRGFIPAAEFDKTMKSIYDNFPHIQGPVDAAMAATDGLGKAEAVEEYLSDYAALLETNLLLRVWNAVKGALNALGLKFADDYPRYLINHARQYARRPGGGHFADMDTIAQRANGVETGAIAPGRYKRSDELFGNVESMMSTARLLVGDRPILKAAEKRVITDLPNTWEAAKNEFLSLFPFQARKNPGLKELNEIITDGEQRTQHIRNLLDEEAAPALNKAIKVPGVDFEFGGVTEAETALMNNALAVARIRAAQGLLADPKANQSKTPIFTYDKTTGTFKETVIDPATGETEADRLASLYAITRDEFDSEFTATIKRETGEQEVRKYVRDPKVTNTDRAWDGYQRLRRAFVEAQKILLLAKLSANTVTVGGALEEIASLMPNNRLTSEQRRLIRKASQLYSDLYNKGIGVDTRTGQMQADPEAIKQAEEFLQAFNTAIIADKPADQDTDLSNKNSAASRNKNLRDIIAKVASKQEADDIVASIENFKDAVRVEVTGQPGKFVSGLRKDQYLIQQKIASLNTAQFAANNGEQSFRYLVASQFTPIIQKGNYQVRIVPVSADGDPVALGDAYGGSVGYTQFATQSEADAFAEAFMAKQVDENGDPLIFEADTKGGAGETVKASIRLEARVDEVQSDVLAPTRMGLQEFMMQIAHYSVPLTPEKRQEIMIDATRQDDRARKRLLTEFTPGDPRLGVEAIAQHIEGLASTAAKIEMRPRIERLMSRRNKRSQELWDGDPKRVEATKARYERLMADPGASREQVDAAQRDYEEAKMLFDETGGMPNKYKNQAGKLLAFINDNETLTESNFDASAFISTWRTLTAVAQLGLNFVTAALNPVSVYTNVAPYLATRNSKTAFGGGFGMGRTMTELNRAFTQVGLPGTLPTKESAKFNEASFWEGVAVNGALQKKYKVTDFEARMLAQEIRRGSMQPTLTNSLVNMSRGLASTAVGRKVADGMMFMFNVSEQASRRAAGLAAFRMEFARRVATIDPDLKGADYEAAVEQSYRESTKFVREMLDLTIGNYATSKRPNFFRGGWPGILYMYKVFPTTSIQLFRNMDAKGKMWMLAGLWALGGIAAWPFAEEIEDLLDTLDQKFGLGVGTGSIRAFAVQEFDTIMPGLGQLILTGGFGQFLPLDIASRVSLSAVPGTEFFLAGTDRARMYEEIAGPMPSALFGAGAAILDAVRAPFSTTITAEDVAREAPVTAIRLLADTYAYLNSGAIVDRRGYVVSPDVKWYDIAARMAGGYPISAAEGYGAIRVINRTVNHRREVSAQYRSDWVQASIRGDFARRREIEEAVREWNRTHRGTPLEITNFRQGAQRALREARRPATERTLRTTPTAGRSVSEDIIDALTR